jgi:hypothetical protein
MISMLRFGIEVPGEQTGLAVVDCNDLSEEGVKYLLKKYEKTIKK